MFDGIKVLDLSVSADTLMICPSLNFEGKYSQTTGELKTDRLIANDRGLTFALTPRQNGTGYRVEVSGSIHRYFNDGLHNADDFTARNLLAALDLLVSSYAINPISSRLNNVEFGVNIVLPFPVARVLKNLVAYKGKPFILDTRSETPYYQCQTQRYVVKLYDKGKQYRNIEPGLSENLLRVEVKVLKMAYLQGRGINLNTLADLLTVGNYRLFGALLVETFMEILFDEPTINPETLTAKERDIYQNGRNAKFWELSDDLTGRERAARWKPLERAEKRYRELLARHRKGIDWQSETASLITQKWEHLTAVDDRLLTTISDRLKTWNNSEEARRSESKTCPLLTDSQPGKLSTFNPLYSGLILDKPITSFRAINHGREIPDDAMQTPLTEPRRCIVTGLNIDDQRGAKRYVSTSTVRKLYEHDRATFDALAGRYLSAKQAGANLDKQCYHIAHNIRNAYTNPRNNPVARLRKYVVVREGQTLPLFPAIDTVQPTDRQRAALDIRRGTRWEMPL
ncbi:hypothetical protein [Fibrella forsythiae]|uniref:Replication-associated protein G2P N-terminal domain-containing protein n=1 Tax=Fibrella forsythiae TaxID=2817061 RepID=A0ABS3JHH6_9BACT|nr:hypothetical protein [Fibrella forsythiae]MBO0949459.1 hypothetical protein [Fibrella forsythiae]